MAFSSVPIIKTRYRSQIEINAVLRLAVTKLDPNIHNLISRKREHHHTRNVLSVFFPDSRLNNAFKLCNFIPKIMVDFHKRILFSDEAHFWLNGYVNKQNCRIWSEANPQVYVETPLHPEKLTVWCALWAGGILLQKR
ncbi:hypothetical protein TNCV_2742131 [Trichonephila clavipes]|nr:hypothetical protein TNCV_2742131 [Trichonephila clavipes]